MLGIGVGLAGPGSVAFAAGDPPANTAAGPVPDWPAAPVPDWPAAQPSATHMVVRGECLWQISGAWAREQTGRPLTNAEVAVAVSAWWHGNATVIGPDPDRLLPGQVLRPPEGP